MERTLVKFLHATNLSYNRDWIQDSRYGIRKKKLIPDPGGSKKRLILDPVQQHCMKDSILGPQI
jgi:hypothetical protein